MKKTPILIAVFTLFCAVPAMAADGARNVKGQFHALSGLSGMQQQELTPLSDQELGTVEGQGVEVLIFNSAYFVVNVTNIDIDVRARNINLNLGKKHDGKKHHGNRHHRFHRR
jgi:hypothetical protein